MDKINKIANIGLFIFFIFVFGDAFKDYLDGNINYKSFVLASITIIIVLIISFPRYFHKIFIEPFPSMNSFLEKIKKNT